MSKVIALCNQKGGVGKTTSTANIGYGLARMGKKVLLVDCDPQASLTISLGISEPDTLEAGLPEIMERIIDDKSFNDIDCIFHHEEGVDLVPSHIGLSGTELKLTSIMSREKVLSAFVETVKDNYDYVLIDCMPSLGMLTINALTAANGVIIPCQPHYLSTKGLEQLAKTIMRVKRFTNPGLTVDGILLTMVDTRAKYTREIIGLLRETYDGKIKVYQSEIPMSVKASEISAEGKSIFTHDKYGKVAAAYKKLTEEVNKDGADKQREKHKAQECR